MTDFKEGDIVQVVTTESFPDKFYEYGKLARDFYGVEGTPHPFFGMIGFVYEIKSDGKVRVFFSKSYTTPEPSNTPGWTCVCGPEQLVKIGTAAVHPPYEKLRKVADQLSVLFAEVWNKEHGTDFKTQDEVMESLIKK